MTMDIVGEIPGAAALRDWFGRFPRFHDAQAELQINGNGTGWLKAYGFHMTDKVNDRGYYVHEKHFVATFFFDEMTKVALSDFLPGRAILASVEIRKAGTEFEIAIDTSYGLAGSIFARRIRLEFEPTPNETA